MKRYALICPGRGSYTEASLGSLNRAYNDGDVYQAGEQVTVMHIDGATAVVWQNP